MNIVPAERNEDSWNSVSVHEKTVLAYANLRHASGYQEETKKHSLGQWRYT